MKLEYCECGCGKQFPVEEMISVLVQNKYREFEWWNKDHRQQYHQERKSNAQPRISG